MTTYCTLYCLGGRGGQNYDLLPSNQQVDDLAYLLKKVGLRGQCLLPSTFGKFKGQGTIFDFGFSKKFNLSLLSTLGLVLDRCRAFEIFAGVDVDAHLCLGGRGRCMKCPRDHSGRTVGRIHRKQWPFPAHQGAFFKNLCMLQKGLDS